MAETPGQSFTENPDEDGTDEAFPAGEAGEAAEADEEAGDAARGAADWWGVARSEPETADGRVVDAGPDPLPDPLAAPDDNCPGPTGSAEARASHGVSDESCEGKSLGTPGSTYVGAWVVRTAGPVLSADGAPVAPGVGGHAVREAGMPASTGTAVLRMPHPLRVTAAIAATTTADSAAVAACPRRRPAPGPAPCPGAPSAGEGPGEAPRPKDPFGTALVGTALVRADLATVRWVVLIA
ncbi:hypothetical protein [Streptacidiphilus neutrinimicus]|uniref:hypothetical protein n=1 Tax=Streptacidiphilus neutrinimicus TaxID=105420 RepID=UPI000AE337B9|nr:hypothetical protein [Streptacidiphilus neutrinimicus]